MRYSTSGAGPLSITETYSTDGRALDWNIDLAAIGSAVRVGDFGISLPVQGPTGENPAQIFERGFLKHQFHVRRGFASSSTFALRGATLPAGHRQARNESR
ncbi:MAG: hypothetical protein IPL75_16040 [Acidobacteria bacterium]|nr:hypothetical protein [Acidobacteriota bacterium]